MCKSCYVCFNRKKKGLKQLPLTLKIRQRRKPVYREESNFRTCVGCQSGHSSGDWYRDQKDPSSFNCQKCYQRKNRDKLKRKSKIGFCSDDDVDDLKEDRQDYDDLDSPLTPSTASTANNPQDLFEDLVKVSRKSSLDDLDNLDNTREKDFSFMIAA